MKKLFIPLILITILVVSCNQKQTSPLYKEKISKNNLIDLTKKIKNDKMMSHEEVQLFTNGLSRMVTNEDSIESKTIGDVIEYQREYLRENAVNNMVFNVNRVKMMDVLKMKYLGLVPRDTNNQQSNIIVCEVENTTEQDIKNLDGYLNFYNNQNQLVKRYNIKTKEAIEPGKKRIVIPFIHDPENRLDVMMRTNNKLRPIWNPTTVELEDGTIFTTQKEEEKEEESNNDNKE